MDHLFLKNLQKKIKNTINPGDKMIKKLVLSLLFLNMCHSYVFSMEREEKPIHIQGNSKVIEAVDLFNRLSGNEKQQFFQIVKNEEQQGEVKEDSSVMRAIKKQLNKPWKKFHKKSDHFESQRERVAEAYQESGNDELLKPNDVANT